MVTLLNGEILCIQSWNLGFLQEISKENGFKVEEPFLPFLQSWYFLGTFWSLHKKKSIKNRFILLLYKQSVEIQKGPLLYTSGSNLIQRPFFAMDN